MFRFLIVVVLLQCAIYICAKSDDYKIPPPEIIVSRNSLEILLPDENGIELFYFYGRITKKNGEVIKTLMHTTTTTNGGWILTDYNIVLEDGDLITYWLYVKKNGISYRMPYGTYLVQGVMSYMTTTTENENGALTSYGTENTVPIANDPVNLDNPPKDEKIQCDFSCEKQLSNLTRIVTTMELHMDSLEEMVIRVLEKLNRLPNNDTNRKQL